MRRTTCPERSAFLVGTSDADGVKQLDKNRAVMVYWLGCRLRHVPTSRASAGTTRSVALYSPGLTRRSIAGRQRQRCDQNRILRLRETNSKPTLQRVLLRSPNFE